jgi:hypothetical protein
MTSKASKPMTTPSKDARTQVSTYDDGRFIRTALIISGSEVGSIDLVNAEGVRLAQINISHLPNGHGNGHGDECTIVDVIDMSDRYQTRSFPRSVHFWGLKAGVK